MKVLSSGDHHWDERSRFQECIRIHDWMVDVARRERIDLFLSGGDVFERESTPSERDAVAQWLTAMAQVCPVVIAKGNHDRPLDVALMQRLHTRHPVIVEERAGVHYVGGAAVATMAWPERISLLASARDHDDAETQVRDALRAVLRGLGDECDGFDGPRILLGHFMVDGAISSTGQPLRGRPINVGLTDLALARASLGIMAHIHRADVFDAEGAPHFYTGSPFRTDFGQTETKSVLLAEFDGSRLVRTEAIETPCTPMVHADARFEPGEVMGSPDGMPQDVAGAEIRLRYDVPREQREAGRAAANALADALRARGAAHVKLEERVTVESRARAPEVASAATPTERLETYWRTKPFDPGARRGPLLDKFSVLQLQSREA
jgi:Calcineurin-like phosphoesterase